QRLMQMAQRNGLVIRAMHRIHCEHGIAIAPARRFVEIIPFDGSSDLLALQQEWLQVGANETVSNMSCDQCAAASNASAELDHIPTEKLMLDQNVRGHASKAPHGPLRHRALPKAWPVGKHLLSLDL